MAKEAVAELAGRDRTAEALARRAVVRTRLSSETWGGKEEEFEL